MININKVFKMQKNLIFAINKKHNIKVTDIVVDNKGIKYQVVGVCFQTNDLLVEPLSTIENLDRLL